MGMSEKKGTFDALNDALFAQIDRLAQAEGDEDVRKEIERSEAVSKLAGNVIGNAKTAVALLKMQQDAGMEIAGKVAEPPRMLGGGS